MLMSFLGMKSQASLVVDFILCQVLFHQTQLLTLYTVVQATCSYEIAYL